MVMGGTQNFAFMNLFKLVFKYMYGLKSREEIEFCSQSVHTGLTSFLQLTTIISLNGINRVMFLIEQACVFCEVVTEASYEMYSFSPLKGSATFFSIYKDTIDFLRRGNKKRIANCHVLLQLQRSVKAGRTHGTAGGVSVL